jgi:hypothetical protein
LQRKPSSANFFLPHLTFLSLPQAIRTNRAHIVSAKHTEWRSRSVAKEGNGRSDRSPYMFQQGPLFALTTTADRGYRLLSPTSFFLWTLPVGFLVIRILYLVLLTNTSKITFYFLISLYYSKYPNYYCPFR